MLNPNRVVDRACLRWINEEITLDDFVDEMQRMGWSKAWTYDWLCAQEDKRGGHPEVKRVRHSQPRHQRFGQG